MYRQCHSKLIMVIAIFSHHHQHLANSKCPDQLANMMSSTTLANWYLDSVLHLSVVQCSPQIHVMEGKLLRGGQYQTCPTTSSPGTAAWRLVMSGTLSQTNQEIPKILCMSKGY